nr:MBOAT family protein [Lachnospiraceae bacterium]
MVFSSIIFLYFFLPLCLLLYFLVPGIRAKNVILLLFSLLFYGWGEPVYILLMLLNITVNYFLGRLMEWEPDKKKRTLVFAVFFNLLVLGFFKYYGFLIESINGLLGTSLPVRKLPLPIGISFYTFQTLSYIIDLYRGKFKAQRSLIRFGLYISMYFQLIAGPIVRYHDVEKQLSQREISARRLGKGLAMFLFGLGKKVLIANLVGELFDILVSGQTQFSTLGAWIGAIAYTLQIYFDFSGYSDMAVGLGHAFGFDFPENFRTPYLSSSVTEFWRRWHISLGTWFREYVYIPLGGNRGGAAKHIRNILIVWALTGLWHGANWTFVLWGLYYAVFLLIEKYVVKKRVPVLGNIVTLLIVVVGWVLFSSNDLAEVGVRLSAMAGFGALGLTDTAALFYLREYAVWLILGIVLCLPFAARLKTGLLWKHRVLTGLIALLILVISTAFLVTQNYNPFLYFRF